MGAGLQRRPVTAARDLVDQSAQQCPDQIRQFIERCGKLGPCSGTSDRVDQERQRERMAVGQCHYLPKRITRDSLNGKQSLDGVT